MHLLHGQSALGWPSTKDSSHAHLGMLREELGDAQRLSFWRCTRTASVLIRAAVPGGVGIHVPPSVVRVEWMVSIKSRRPATIPQIRSECPAKYFVPECMTRSMPKSAGRWLMGVAKVLSIKLMSLCCRARAVTFFRSTTRSVGLVGDSR